jgi:hypothetical protein
MPERLCADWQITSFCAAALVRSQGCRRTLPILRKSVDHLRKGLHLFCIPARGPGRRAVRPVLSGIAAATFCALLLMPAYADASTYSPGTITVTGAVPPATGSLTILAQVEVASQPGPHDVPGRLTDHTVARVSEPAGTAAFSLSVPRSPMIVSAAQQNRGIAEFDIMIESGRHVWSQYVPVAVASTSVTRSDDYSSQLSTHIVRLPKFPKMRSLPSSRNELSLSQPQDTTNCVWTKNGSEYEGITRIGQMHVADLTGMTDAFEYQNYSDTTETVGLSWSSASGYSVDGSVSITNSIGTDSGFTAGEATLRYVQSHMYYQQYYNNGAASCPAGTYKVEAVQDAGDSFLESSASEPARNPYTNGCLGDTTYGYATIPVTGYFNSDKGTAETISSAQNWSGFEFSTTSGFSTDLYDDYHNGTSGNVYVCGQGYMPDVPNLYNNTW